MRVPASLLFCFNTKAVPTAMRQPEIYESAGIVFFFGERSAVSPLQGCTGDRRASPVQVFERFLIVLQWLVGIVFANEEPGEIVYQPAHS